MKLASFTIDGHSYDINLLDEREDGVEHDPTLLVFRDLDEEAVLTFHPVPGTPCIDHHPVGRPYEEER